MKNQYKLLSNQNNEDKISKVLTISSAANLWEKTYIYYLIRYISIYLEEKVLSFVNNFVDLI